MAHRKKVSRNHNLRRIKTNYAYRIEEICKLLGVHPNTIYDWKKRGLGIVEDSYPILIHGSQLISFLKEEKRSRLRPCGLNEFYCFKCQLPRKPHLDLVVEYSRKPKSLTLLANCEVCGTKTFKTVSTKDLTELATLLQISQAGEVALEGLLHRTCNNETNEARYDY